MAFSYTDIVPLYDNTDALKVANKGTYTPFMDDIILELREDVDYLGELRGMTGANWTSNHFDWTKGTTIALEAGHEVWMSYIKDLRTACEELYTDAGLGSPSWTIATANLKSLYDNTGAIIVANKSTFTRRTVSLITDVRTALKAVASVSYYFVDALNGNDTTGDGTAANPYQTWNKVVTVINTAGSGSAFFMPGTYQLQTRLTTNNVSIVGSALGDVTFRMPESDPGTRYPFYTCTGVTVSNVFFSVDMATSYYYIFVSASGLTVNNCIFRNTYAGGTTYTAAILGANITLNHCTVIGSKSGQDRGLWFNTTATTLNDVLFLSNSTCLYFTHSGTVTENNCGFYDYTTQHGGTGSPSITQNNNIFTDPKLSKNNYHLRSDSPYIGAASDSFDIGAYQNGWYNGYQLITETITASNPSVIDKSKAYISEVLTVTEGVETTSMGITIKMFLGGIFNSAADGEMTYLDSTTATAMVEDNPSFVYNGAALDVSFTNTGGDLCKLYITADDGVSPYEQAWWWDTNATSNEAGSTTLTYFIDAYKDFVTGNEWGTLYDYSTVAADGVNDQQADITLKMRVKNINTGVWSELITLSNTYYFNDFDKTQYYFADNPRMVDGEYANHANYYAQAYHTGTTKYTRPDGVNWSADGRRFAYNPMFKSAAFLTTIDQQGGGSLVNAYSMWQNRLAATFPYTVMTHFMLYACIYSNFGNWNYNGDHCFADVTHQPYDKGSATASNPVLGSDASDLHYLMFTGYTGSDCVYHSSHQSIMVRFPTNENISYSHHVGLHKELTDSEFYFAWGDNPFVACLPDYKYFLWVKHILSGVPGDYTPYTSTGHEYYVNRTNTAEGGYTYGNITKRASVISSTGEINYFW